MANCRSWQRKWPSTNVILTRWWRRSRRTRHEADDPNRSSRNRCEIVNLGEGDLRKTGAEYFPGRNNRAGTGTTGDGGGWRKPVGTAGSDLGEFDDREVR